MAVFTSVNIEENIKYINNSNVQLDYLEKLIELKDQEYHDKFSIANQLNRKLVSFQANKKSPIYKLF